ncbi:MAG: stage V sporulation protein AD [Clostridia bacterium]|nr:stage V sporulation protein AD [Clostridia bacterium]
MGKHTIYFSNKPRIISTFTIAGPKESESNFGKHIHKLIYDDRFGEDTFEKAECKMLSYAIENVIKSANISRDDIDALVSGDLLNQIISASFAARDFDIPYIGIYNACSTFSEGFAISASLVDGGYMKKIVTATGSHFATAERQYRYPLELGCTRPPQAQWTVTGAGACVIADSGDYPKIVSATFGKVVDFGITDANNMGAAMAPAACDTLACLFKDTNTKPSDYDLILTGDLGALGSRLVKELVKEKGYDMDNVHADCGEMIYNIEEEKYQGGSGAGCSAVVFGSYIYDKLKKKELNKIIFMATGALLSPVSTQQGESIPCVAHAVVLES